MKIKIEKIDVNEFMNFIKKLTSVDKLIYLKIADGKITSNVYLPERDAVKLQSILVSNLFDIKGDLPKETIRLSFFNGNRAIEALKHFQSLQGIRGELECTELDGGYTATSFKIYNDELKIKLLCTDPSIAGFIDLTPEQIQNIFSVDSKTFQFEMEPFHIEKLSSLFQLEKENQTFKIENNGGGVKFKGESYETLVTPKDEMAGQEEGLVQIYKKYIPLIDKESYNVIVCPNKIVLKSIDSQTYLTVSVCQTGD